MAGQVSSVKLLNAATTTATGETHAGWTWARTYQATGFTTAGSGAADVIIEVSNDNSLWITMATITLTLGTTATTDGFASAAAWRYVRARVSSISGTGAQVTAWMGA